MNIKSIFAVAFMATALVGTTFTLASCENDEKPETIQGVVVDGTYITTLNMGTGAGNKFMSLASVKGQKVTVKSNGDNKILEIDGYVIELPAEPGVPDKFIVQDKYELKNVKAKLADGTVTLSGEEEVTMKLHAVGSTEETANVPFKDYKVKVTTKGTIKNGKLELTNTFQPKSMQFPVVYTYAGQK